MAAFARCRPTCSSELRRASPKRGARRRAREAQGPAALPHAAGETQEPAALPHAAGETQRDESHRGSTHRLARFRLIVFDLDGTLVDSRRDLTDAANELIVACGGAPLSEATVATMIGEGARVLVERAFATAGVPRPADALERFLAIYDHHLLVHTRPYAGMPRVLDELRRDARLAVLTNKPTAPSVRLLEGLGLARHFAEVVGGDSHYGRKPDPAGLAALMARGEASPETTLMVGDSAIDLQTAQGAGCAICLARYGFSYWTVQGRLSGAEHIIDAPGDLLDIVRRV